MGSFHFAVLLVILALTEGHEQKIMDKVNKCFICIKVFSIVKSKMPNISNVEPAEFARVATEACEEVLVEWADQCPSLMEKHSSRFHQQIIDASEGIVSPTGICMLNRLCV